MTGLSSRAGGTFIKEALQQVKVSTAALLSSAMSLHNEFEHDVLERLLALGANSLGAPIVGVQCVLDGQIRIMCMGTCPDGFWRKYTLRFSTTYLKHQKYLGDPQAVAEIAYQILGDHPPQGI